jgi:hypothetical protein
MGKKLGLDKSYNALKITLGKYPLTSIGKNSPSSAFMSRALKLNTPPLVNSKLLNVGKKVFSKTPVGKGLNLALNVGKALKKTLTSKTNIGVSSAIAGFEAKNQIDKNPKVFDISLKEMIGKKTDKKMGGGMMQGYGAARTSGMGLEDQSLPSGKMVRANTGKMLNFKSDKERKDYTKQAIASLEGITESFKDKLNPMKAQRLLDRLPKKKIKKNK